MNLIYCVPVTEKNKNLATILQLKYYSD